MLVLGCSQGGGAVTVATVGDATEGPASTTAITTADNADQANPTATTADVPENRSVTLAAVGDVMLARSIGQLVLDEGATAVFQGVREELLDADVTFANVESAISDRGAPAQKGYTFEAPPETIAALVDAGIDGGPGQQPRTGLRADGPTRHSCAPGGSRDCGRGLGKQRSGGSPACFA